MQGACNVCKGTYAGACNAMHKKVHMQGHALQTSIYIITININIIYFILFIFTVILNLK